jgi:hypothetical protein
MPSNILSLPATIASKPIQKANSKSRLSHVRRPPVLAGGFCFLTHAKQDSASGGDFRYYTERRHSRALQYLLQRAKRRNQTAARSRTLPHAAAGKFAFAPCPDLLPIESG